MNSKKEKEKKLLLKALGISQEDHPKNTSYFDEAEVFTWSGRVLIVKPCTFCQAHGSVTACDLKSPQMLQDVQSKDTYPECMFRNHQFNKDELQAASQEQLGKLIIDSLNSEEGGNDTSP